jgi:hypothetical protein
MQACEFLCHVYLLSPAQSLTLLGLCMILIALTRMIPSDTSIQSVPLDDGEE